MKLRTFQILPEPLFIDTLLHRVLPTVNKGPVIVVVVVVVVVIRLLYIFSIMILTVDS